MQALLPLLRTTGNMAQVAYGLWLATFPVLIGVALRNRDAPGMAVIALGLASNLLVVSVNGGMPVMPNAASAAGLHGQLIVAVGDFVHVVGTAATKLPWLADAVPLAGPSWFRLVPSPGDALIYAGVVAFVAGADPSTDG
jgi:hypothetical protein